jgi:small-conductance mechanosensitive channel
MYSISGLSDLIPKEDIINLIWIAAISAVVIIIFFSIYKFIKGVLLKKAKTKKQKSNVIIFLNIVKYLFVFIFILVFLFSYFGSWTELGLIMGLISVALGFALQRPITNVIAWVILVVRKPFFIGDRIAINGLKGDVQDISISYITLEEIGGTIDGEEKSGRIAVVPNSIIFEKEIVNYTAQHDFILDEVVVSITYESDLKKAENIAIKAVEKVMGPFLDSFPKKIPREPHIRLKFMDSAMQVSARYHVLALNRNMIKTAITREIFEKIVKTKDVEIAYPHTEVILRK